MERMLTGYVFIIILMPLFIMLLIFTTTEANRVQSFHDVLDEKITIDRMELSQSSFITDRNGQVISEIHKPYHRIYVSTEIIPDFLKNIFIASEDQNFYEHPGFDLSAIGRALAVNLKAKSIEEGASTITQQLARNLYLSHEQSYNRKLSEVLYAYQLERMYSKEDILELYLNTVYFNNGAYGIEAAATTYFQKSIAELTNGELAFLAAIPNNPSLYNPLTSFERTKDRQERLLDQLQKSGYMSKEEAEKTKAEPIRLAPKERIDLYPDYVTYVEAELKELIAQTEGIAARSAEHELEEKVNERFDEVIASGVIIETALHPAIQTKAKETVKRYLPYDEIEGAVTVIDHQQQEIIALIGGKEYEKHNFHRAFQAYRQPGSAIKPLLVYAPYLERTNAGLYDRVSADSFCSNGYCPENYGGANYGSVTLEQAFMYSYNTPAVRLLDKIGIMNGFEDLSQFQFKKVTAQDHVLPAAIGGFTYGMSVLELTNAFTTFATGGDYEPAHAIRQVTDLSGNILYKWEEQPVDIWSEPTIEKMRSLLQRAVISGTGRKAYFPSGYIGGKTGTTNDYHDYWFVGLTEEITAGVWVGKDTPANIKYVESAAPHLRIWREIATEIEKGPL